MNSITSTDGDVAIVCLHSNSRNARPFAVGEGDADMQAFNEPGLQEQSAGVAWLSVYLD